MRRVVFGPSDMGTRIRVYARRVTQQHTGWDAAAVPRRHRVDAAGLRRRAGRLARRRSAPTPRRWSSTRAPASPAASGSGPRSAGGVTRPSPSPPTDEAALLRACASLELLHASALVHDDYMDASDVRRGRPATHRAFEAAAPRARLVRQRRAVRRLRRDPARRPAAELVRRAAAHLRAARRAGARRAGLLRPDPQRGGHRPVPRRLRPGPRRRPTSTPR